LLGSGATLRDVAHLVGALDDATAYVGHAPDREQVQVVVQHPDFEHWERHIQQDATDGCTSGMKRFSMTIFSIRGEEVYPYA
jgi:hypothetical protein